MAIPSSFNNILTNTPHNSTYNNFNSPPAYNIELLNEEIDEYDNMIPSLNGGVRDMSISSTNQNIIDISDSDL